MKPSSSTGIRGDRHTRARVRTALRDKAMFLKAFKVTPVLEPTQLFEALKRVKGRRTPKTALERLVLFTLMVKTVAEMGALFSAETARTFHGLSQADYDFLVDCWESAGSPTTGAQVLWQ